MPSFHKISASKAPQGFEGTLFQRVRQLHPITKLKGADFFEPTSSRQDISNRMYEKFLAGRRIS